MNEARPLKLGEILLNARIIDQLQLNTALKYQKAWDRKLGESLVELGFLSEEVLVKVLSKFLKVPAVELSQIRVNPLAVQKVPKRLADKYGAFPIDLEGQGSSSRLVVAMTDPTNLNAIDEIAFISGSRIRAVVASHSDIEKAIRRHYGEDRVVDIFFSLEDDSAKRGPEPLATGAVPLNFTEDYETPIEKKVHSPTQSDEEMIIMRRGEETLLRMEEENENPEQPAAPMIPAEHPLPKSAQERSPQSSASLFSEPETPEPYGDSVIEDSSESEPLMLETEAAAELVLEELNNHIPLKEPSNAPSPPQAFQTNPPKPAPETMRPSEAAEEEIVDLESPLESEKRASWQEASPENLMQALIVLLLAKGAITPDELEGSLKGLDSSNRHES